MQDAANWIDDHADIEESAHALADQILKLDARGFLQICLAPPSPLDTYMSAESPKSIVMKSSRRDYIFREHTWVIEHLEQVVLAILDPHEIREDKAYNRHEGSKELRVVFYRKSLANNQMAVVVTFRPEGNVSHSIHTAFPVRSDFMIRRREQEELIWRIGE